MNLEVAKDMGSVIEQVMGSIYEILPDSAVTVTEGTWLFEDLEFDSIATMQLLVAVEETFGFDSETDNTMYKKKREGKYAITRFKEIQGFTSSYHRSGGLLLLR